MKVINMFGAAGSGKAQPLYSKVLTEEGWKEFKDLEITDKIYTEDGSVSKLKYITPIQYKDIYRIYFKDGRFTDCSEDHLWKLYRNGWDSSKIISLKDFKDILNTKTYKQRPLFVELFYPLYQEKILPINPYLLGILIGDGNILEACKFTSTDQEIVDKVTSIINKEYPSLYVKKIKNKYGYNIRRYNYKQPNILYNKLKDLNLLCKSEFKFIPKEYFIASLDQKINLLQGLFDTDGYAAENNGLSYSSSSKQLALDVQELCRSIGLKANITKKITTHLDSYTVWVSGWCKNKLISLSRKSKRIFLGQYDNKMLAITNIEFIGKLPCKCISLEHSSHMYLTDNFIPTHNSTNSAGLAYELKKDGFKVELVTEFAKELCITKSEHLLENQIWVFGNQYHKMKYLSDDLDFIITDSPIMLSAWYGKKYNYQFESLYPLIKEVHNSFDNINIFLERAHSWDPYARVQSEEESNQDSINLQNFLKENQISFEIFQTGRYLPAILKKYILDSNYHIVEKHHNKNEKTVTNKKLFGSPISGIFYKDTPHPSQEYISSYNEIVKKYNFKVYEEEYENFNNEIEKLIKDFKSKSNQRLPYVTSYPTWIKLL